MPNFQFAGFQAICLQEGGKDMDNVSTRDHRTQKQHVVKFRKWLAQFEMVEPVRGAFKNGRLKCKIRELVSQMQTLSALLQQGGYIDYSLFQPGHHINGDQMVEIIESSKLIFKVITGKGPGADARREKLLEMFRIYAIFLDFQPLPKQDPGKYPSKQMRKIIPAKVYWSEGIGWGVLSLIVIAIGVLILMSVWRLLPTTLWRGASIILVLALWTLWYTGILAQSYIALFLKAVSKGEYTCVNARIEDFTKDVTAVSGSTKIPVFDIYTYHDSVGFPISLHSFQNLDFPMDGRFVTLVMAAPIKLVVDIQPILDSGDNNAPRLLNKREQSWIQLLLASPVEGGDTLSSQMEDILAQPVYDNNYISFLLFPDRTKAAYAYPSRLPVDAVRQLADGRTLEALIRVKDGYVDTVEIFFSDGSPIDPEDVGLILKGAAFNRSVPKEASEPQLLRTPTADEAHDTTEIEAIPALLEQGASAGDGEGALVQEKQE